MEIMTKEEIEEQRKIGRAVTEELVRRGILRELRKESKYQKALNDIIKNSGTEFNCKHDSFYLMQELVDKYLIEHRESF